MSEDLKSCRYEPIALSNESTVVAEFLPEFLGVREAAYQSEAELEKAFIKQLQVQAYEYLPFTSEAELIANLCRQLERLNKLQFSDAEWERFFSTCIAGSFEGIIEKTARIQEDHIQVLKRDDGSIKNIYLIDKQHIHNNSLQVINQYPSMAVISGVCAEKVTNASHRSMIRSERRLTAQGASPSTNRVNYLSRDETGRSVSATATATIRFRPRDDPGVGLANLRFHARQFCSCKHASKPLPMARA